MQAGLTDAKVLRGCVVESLEVRRLLADVVSISARIPNASETDPSGAGMGQFIVRRTGATTAPLTVNYHVRTGSTAVAGADFAPLSGSVKIPAGRAYSYINIFPIDDNVGEPSEIVIVNIHDGPSFDLGAYSARVTIADNEPVVNVAVQKNASEEDPTGAGFGKFIVRRTGSTAQPLTVNIHPRSTSSADQGDDYATMPATVTIAAGKSYAYVNIRPVDDDIDEAEETVILNIDAGAGYSLGKYFATATIADNDDPAQAWWDDAYRYRIPLSVESGSFARSDRPIERAINFTDALNDLGAGGALIENSIRVVEVTADGNTVLDEDVPLQFDRGSGFNASTNASGTLVFLLGGSTAADATRYFHVYFETSGSFLAPSFTPQVVTTDNQSDEGQTAIKIETTAATYFYQKENGGFSSILDPDGVDWVGFNPTPGSQGAGEYRGIPNAVFPGGGFHPGFVNATTTIEKSGPLKTSIRTDAVIDSGFGNENWSMRWEIYPTYATCTVLVAPRSYWFLFEGVPGGSINSNDTVVRSDGTVTDIDTSWTDSNGLGSSNDSEWVYFRDSGADAFLFLTHHQTDSAVDSYFLMPDGQMTVFGFGRDGTTASLTGTGQRFTIGIAGGGGNFNSAATTINGAYKDVSTSLGAPEERLS